MMKLCQQTEGVSASFSKNTDLGFSQRQTQQVPYNDLSCIWWLKTIAHLSHKTVFINFLIIFVVCTLPEVVLSHAPINSAFPRVPKTHHHSMYLCVPPHHANHSKNAKGLAYVAATYSRGKYTIYLKAPILTHICACAAHKAYCTVLVTHAPFYSIRLFTPLWVFPHHHIYIRTKCNKGNQLILSNIDDTPLNLMNHVQSVVTHRNGVPLPENYVFLPEYLQKQMEIACDDLKKDGVMKLTIYSWGRDYSVILNKGTTWKWFVTCDGTHNPVITRWHDGAALLTPLNGKYLSSDWTNPLGMKVNSPVNINGPFVWPHCQPRDEGCWTFTQSYYPNENGKHESFPGQVCVTVLRIPATDTELEMPVTAIDRNAICNETLYKIAGTNVPDYASPIPVLKDVLFAMYTWNLSLTEYNVSAWEPRCTGYVQHQLLSINTWLEDGYKEDDGFFDSEKRINRTSNNENINNTGGRPKRSISMNDVFTGAGVGVGILNTIDLEMVRKKLSIIASHSADGLSVELEIERLLVDMQHHIVNATTMLHKEQRKKFKALIELLKQETDALELAIACTQVQAELNDEFRVMVSTMYNGRIPYNLRYVVKKTVSAFAWKHQEFWVSSWKGCKDQMCSFVTLVPANGTLLTAYKPKRIGIVFDNGLLKPTLPDQYHIVIMPGGSQRYINMEDCWMSKEARICPSAAGTISGDPCWESGYCVLEYSPAHNTAFRSLGSGHWCFYNMNKKAKANYTIFSPRCKQEVSLEQGAYCTAVPVIGIDGPNKTYCRTPHTANKVISLKSSAYKSLLKLPTDLDNKLVEIILNNDISDKILEELNAKDGNNKIKFEHNFEEATNIINDLKAAGRTTWWESIFGYNDKATAILNLMMHPIVILIGVSVLLAAAQFFMCVKIRQSVRAAETALIELKALRVHNIKSSCQDDVL
ncbi:hypothetical protein [Bufonid herpesvirus 1]|uniref:hypothetical protein n=1 Tax=Bufonid herpesvirus 1 TaxID=2282206 RepID=UPI000EB69347|nr:hypothetical protein [Bufonid herpesvirus 1]AXF48633.1 hypothetical protein [Bufonid herpesvirus 1]